MTRSTHSTQSSEGGGSEEEGGSGLGSLRHGYYSSRGASLDGISHYSSRLMVSLRRMAGITNRDTINLVYGLEHQF